MLVRIKIETTEIILIIISSIYRANLTKKIIIMPGHYKKILPDNNGRVGSNLFTRDP